MGFFFYCRVVGARLRALGAEELKLLKRGGNVQSAPCGQGLGDISREMKMWQFFFLPNLCITFVFVVYFAMRCIMGGLSVTKQPLAVTSDGNLFAQTAEKDPLRRRSTSPPR